MPRRRHPLLRTSRVLRTPVCALLTVVAGQALWEDGSGVLAWAFLIASGLVWPQVAWYIGIRLPTEAAQEDSAYYAFAVDSLLSGFLVFWLGLSAVSALAFFRLVVTSLTGGPRRAALALVAWVTGGLVGLFVTGSPGLPHSPDVETSAAVLTTLVFLLGLGYAFFTSERARQRRKRQLEAARADKERQMQRFISELGRFLPNGVHSAILSGAASTTVNSTRSFITVFFCDIIGFTPLVERLSPGDLAVVLNDYFELVTLMASKYGGTVDKFIGDSVFVLFGAPNSAGVEADARACVMMALELQQELAGLRSQHASQGLPPLHVRVGIHSGVCTVGNFGSENHLEYTAIGHAVNVAKRIEGACPQDSVLISHSTRELIQWAYELEPKGELALKGVSAPIRVYEPRGPTVPE